MLCSSPIVYKQWLYGEQGHLEAPSSQRVHAAARHTGTLSVDGVFSPPLVRPLLLGAPISVLNIYIHCSLKRTLWNHMAVAGFFKYTTTQQRFVFHFQSGCAGWRPFCQTCQTPWTFQLSLAKQSFNNMTPGEHSLIIRIIKKICLLDLHKLSSAQSPVTSRLWGTT